MLYLEDYIEMIEHLPSEFKMRFTDMRKLDENVQKMLSDLEDRQKSFFGSCRKLKPPERDVEFNNIRSEYQKAIEDSNDKVQIAEETYGLLDKYLRKLDKELGDFKLELEADNRGITEILEKNSLEMDQPTLCSHKENRVPKRPRKHIPSLFNGSNHVKSDRQGSFSSSLVDSLLSGPAASLPIYGASGSGSPNPFASLEPFAMAASQAIAATQHFGGGRRGTISKASLESVSFPHDFGGSSALSGTDTPTSVGSPSSAPAHKKKKTHSRNASQSASTPTSLLLDVVMNGDESGQVHTGDPLLDASQDLGWTSDVNEPRYCVCNQVSWGDMVACDNDECPFEWFHYSCVGITTPPKGKWFCSACASTMSRKKTNRK